VSPARARNARQPSPLPPRFAARAAAGKLALCVSDPRHLFPAVLSAEGMTTASLPAAPNILPSLAQRLDEWA